MATELPYMITELPAYIRGRREAGETDTQIRAAIGTRRWADRAVAEAFGLADSPAAEAAEAAEREARYQRRLSREHATRVAPRPANRRPRPSGPAGMQCRICGGPACDGTGVCDSCR